MKRISWIFFILAGALISSGCHSTEDRSSSITAEATPTQSPIPTVTSIPTEKTTTVPEEETENPGIPMVSSVPTPEIVPTSEPTPTMQSSEETPEPTVLIVDMMDYLENFKALPELLDMGQGDEWQFSEGNSYAKGGFKVTWLEGYDIFSARNEQVNQVTIFGIQIGDTLAQAKEAALGNGWYTEYERADRYNCIAIFNDQEYYLSFTGDNNGIITDWYLNNWPEGEWVAETYERLRQYLAGEIPSFYGR